MPVNSHSSQQQLAMASGDGFPRARGRKGRKHGRKGRKGGRY